MPTGRVFKYLTKTSNSVEPIMVSRYPLMVGQYAYASDHVARNDET